MTIEINGMAHVILTVSRFDLARDFYRKLLPQFGMKPVYDGDQLFYCVGGRTAIGIEPCDPALASERFVQQRVGLHHLCLRARSREDVDRCASVLKEMAATIIRGPMEGHWAPGYYYVLFEDPDGIRLEVCFVPGAGLLATGASFNPSEGYIGGSASGVRSHPCRWLQSRQRPLPRMAKTGSSRHYHRAFGAGQTRCGGTAIAGEIPIDRNGG